jgi:hypothetical protein
MLNQLYLRYYLASDSIFASVFRCVLVTLSLGAHLALAGRVSIGVCYSFFVYSFSFAFALSNVTATLGELAKGAGTVARTLSMVRRCEQGVAPNAEDQELAVLQDSGVVWAQGVDNGECSLLSFSPALFIWEYDFAEQQLRSSSNSKSSGVGMNRNLATWPCLNLFYFLIDVLLRKPFTTHSMQLC